MLLLLLPPPSPPLPPPFATGISRSGALFHWLT
jgi:hypothetical protein